MDTTKDNRSPMMIDLFTISFTSTFHFDLKNWKMDVFRTPEDMFIEKTRSIVHNNTSPL